MALFALGAVAWVIARRFSYPYDLEWMEGGMLCHALRLAEGKPIYATPSVEFIAYAYAPLYPALVALLGRVSGLGVGYGLARALSIGSFAVALTLGYAFARREGGSRACAAAAMGVPLAAFVPLGAFYDLARPDSLFLALTTAAMVVGWWKRASHAGVAAAATLLIAAFLAKQTAAPFMLALGMALLLTSRRVVSTYVGTLAIGLPSLWLLNRASGGWFWTYVFALHQAHIFHAMRAMIDSPARLALLLGPAMALVPWAIARRPSPGLAYAAVVAAAGIVASCLGAGTQWAWCNAAIPGVFFGAMAIGVAAGRLVTGDPAAKDPSLVFGALVLSLAGAPGFLDQRIDPAELGPRASGYTLGTLIPSAADRAAGDALVTRLRAAPGDVLIPFHPFYGHLAGKRTWLHRQGVMDIARAGLGAPSGLAEAIARRDFAVVVMDNKVEGTWQYWPGLRDAYRVESLLAGPPVATGATTEPRFVMVPILAPSPSGQ